MRILSTICLLLLAHHALGQDSLMQKVDEALQQDIRSDAERARDANRQPAEVLAFFGLQEDMTVIEILPAGGWYSKILAYILKDDGQLYVTHPAPSFVSEAFQDARDLPGMEDVVELDWGAQVQGDRVFVGPGTWNVQDADMVLTFRNYHNFSQSERMSMNRSAFDALASGGVYGIVDHTRRHMEADNSENGRRVDPVQVIKEVQEAGFVFEDYSDVLNRPVDELEYEVGNDLVTGSTDRFTLRFRKP